MLNQNIKGFLTLLTVAGVISSVFYGYKGFVEPNLMRNAELFPVDVTEITISPKVEIKEDSAIISWEAEGLSGGIIYSTNKKDCIDKNQECKSYSSKDTGIQHTAEIANLKEGQNYYYKILIENKEFPQESDSFFSFIKPASEKDTSKEIPTDKLDPKKIHDAIKNQDLSYDLNSDGKVNIADLYLLNNNDSGKNPKQ